MTVEDFLTCAEFVVPKLTAGQRERLRGLLECVEKMPGPRPHDPAAPSEPAVPGMRDEVLRQGGVEAMKLRCQNCKREGEAPRMFLDPLDAILLVTPGCPACGAEGLECHYYDANGREIPPEEWMKPPCPTHRN